MELLIEKDWTKEYWKKFGKRKGRQRRSLRKLGLNPRALGTNPRVKYVPTKYIVYIKSEFWKKRRKRYFKKYEKKCLTCGTKKGVGLHHAVYRHTEFGNERDTDLFPLCSVCHREFHEHYGVKGNMLKETRHFVNNYKYIKYQEEGLSFLKSI